MAQQYPQYPPRAFSPPQRTDSPQYGGALQNKRQRLDSPNNAKSPYSSPSMANISLPNQVFSSPYYGSQANGASSTHNYGTPHHSYPSNSAYNATNTTPSQPSPTGPPPSTGMSGNMGPPSKPLDNKPTDLNELGDVLFGAGIDLREEDAALLRSNSSNGPSFSDQLYEAGYQSTTKAKYPYSRDNYYSQNQPAGRDSFYGAGTFNQPAVIEESAEKIAEASRRKAIRRKAEISSYHLNAPFLDAGNLRRRLQKGLSKYQVKMEETGLFRAQGENPPPMQFAVSGPDKNEVIKVVRGQDLLRHDTPYAELLTLLSVATEERMRLLIEDAATLAKGRKTGSHGIVPPEMADIVVGAEAPDASAALPTPNSATPPKDNPLKRSYTEANNAPPLTPISTTSQPPPLPPSTNPITTALNALTKASRSLEEERLQKRKRREAAASLNGTSSQTLGAGSGTSTPDSSSYLAGGDVAPEPKKGVLKKDQKKTVTLTDTQAFAASNKTMNMALGKLGGMGKKLSWMTKGADTGPSNPFLKKPNAVGAAGAGGKSGAGAGSGGAVNGGAAGEGVNGSGIPADRLFGVLREDGVGGRGIQLRDVVSVLEGDGKEKRALQLAYGRLGAAAGQRR